MKGYLHFISFICLVLVLVSCSKDHTVLPDMGYNYFPDQPGKYVIYDVDSFYYDDINNRIDTTKFQLKEKLESKFFDDEGRPTLRIERYVRLYNNAVPYELIPWTLRDVWSANKTSRQVEKNEENIRYIKLVFPVKSGIKWNANVANTLAEEICSYHFIDQPRNIGGLQFDSVLQVNQRIEESLIVRQYNIEKYAKNAGLVYKQVLNVNSQPPSSWAGMPYEADSLTAFYQIPIMQRVTSGVQYTMIVKDFGSE